MSRALLQVAELAAFAGIAAAAHTYVSRRRAPLADALVATAGASMRSVFAIADVVAALVYVAFASAVVPSTVGVPGDLEGALDKVALFALLVALVQVAAHVAVHRVAGHLEPWPPSVTPAADAA